MKAVPRLVVTIIACVIAVCCGAGTALVIIWGSSHEAESSACGLVQLDRTAIEGDHPDWDAVQISHAATIVETGIRRGVPARGWIIALATAMQESSLRNLANATVPESLDYDHDGVGADHDSVGLFQQRPSTGWGSVRELMAPDRAAAKFYDALVAIDGWEGLTLTQAAQAVQRSAFPDAYARWEDPARSLASALTDGAAAYMAAWGCGPADVDLVVSGQGWTVPVTGQLWSRFRTPERPDHYGIDIGAAPGTPIRAAAAGVVRYAECNSPTCAVPGSPEMSGCGWMVVIDHGTTDDWHGVSTRYCHMLNQPLVSDGQIVAAGQTLGHVGSTGNSSAPHLHYEVHLGTHPADGRLVNATARDPIDFHRRVGAPIQGS